jgi:hypothetical protein
VRACVCVCARAYHRVCSSAIITLYVESATVRKKERKKERKPARGAVCFIYLISYGLFNDVFCTSDSTVFSAVCSKCKEM